MIFHENRLPAYDSYVISCLIRYFEKSDKILKCRLLQNIDGALRVKVADSWLQRAFKLRVKLHLICFSCPVKKANQGLKFQTGVLAGQMHIHYLNLSLNFKPRFEKLMCIWLAKTPV